MKRSLLLTSALCLLFVSCSKPVAESTSIHWETLMQNPLFAERYWDDLTDRMVDIQLQKDPKIMNDSHLLSTVDSVRQNALKNASDATKLRLQGKSGQFVTVKEDTQGWTLLLNQNLYFSSDFVTYPGPALKIFLTTVVDPRDSAFPDNTSVEVGRLESPYGAQTYTLPSSVDAKKLRTVVLLDTQLNRIYGFAQLQ